MRAFSVILLITLGTSCSQLVTPGAWAEDSQVLGQALQKKGEQLQTLALAPFTADSAEWLSAGLTGRAIDMAFARQAMVWKALASYAEDVNQVLQSQLIEEKKVEHLAHAFHDLHRHLLQSQIAPSLGLSVEQHREIVQHMLDCRTSLAALEVCQPWLALLCKQLEDACSGLAQQIEEWHDICLRQIDSKWKSSLDSYSLLLAKKQRLEKELAAQTAGAIPATGDPAGELLKLQTLLRGSQKWRQRYANEQHQLNQAFESAQAHVKKTAHAILEWGIAQRELIKAIHRKHDSINLRLLDASARELGQQN